MIPHTYDEWIDCLVKHCKILLTKDFAMERIAVYQNKNNPETKKFIELYGESHWQNILHWYGLVIKK